MTAASAFDASSSRIRQMHELGMCALFLVYVAVMCFLNQRTSRNFVLLSAAGVSVTVHALTLALRRRSPKSDGLLPLAVVADCFCFAAGHVEIQILLRDSVHTPFGFEEPQGDHMHSLCSESLLITLMLFTLLNYAAHFVLRFRQAAVGITLGSALYCSMLVAARTSAHACECSGAHSAGELVLFTIAVVTTLIAKRASESGEKLALRLLAEAKEINSKDSLCQAELKSAAPHALGDPATQSRMPCQKDEAEEVSQDHSFLSLNSAPANLTAASSMATFLREATLIDDKSIGGACAEDEGSCLMDCFPVDATVWAEGEATPLAVKALKAGQRVLCFDTLGNSLKYAEVASVHTDSKAMEWVDVVLADGTQLTMTSDHPVQPIQITKIPGGEQQSLVAKRAVKAADLHPGRDQIMVHKVVTMPVKVARVAKLSAQEKGLQERVSVAVVQADRHAIMVAAPTSGTDVRAMAVGSVDLHQALQQRHQLRVDKTFVDVAGPTPPQASRRTASEPPPLDDRRQRNVESAPAREPVDPPSGASFSGSQSVSMSLSLSSRNGGDVVIRVPCLADDKLGVTSLNRLLQAEEQGWPSWGSKGHSMGQCKPCGFQQRGKCKLGKSCDHCHDVHKSRQVRGKRHMFAMAQFNNASDNALDP